MRALVLLCFAAAFVAVARGQSDDEMTPEMAARLDKNSQMLNKLVARAVQVSDTVSRRGKERDTAEVQSQNMLQRIEQRNGGLCGGRFPCGGAANQCVDNLLVCDGVSDCDTGADELDAICTNPAAPGSTFEGVTVWDKCTRREPKRVRVDFLSEERSAVVKSNLFLDARFFMTYSTNGVSGEDSLPVRCLYYFGRRRMECGAPEEDRLGVDMEFPPGENDVLFAYAVRESSGERCAKFILKRQ